MKALPFWKKRPATAGRSAKPSGKECQCDDSACISSTVDARGRNKSSVDDFIERRDSDKVSDMKELLRLAEEDAGSAKVAARPRERCLRPAVGELGARAVCTASGTTSSASSCSSFILLAGQTNCIIAY